MNRVWIFILLFFVVVAITKCPGQAQEYHWFFGYNGGLDFSSGVPVSDNSSPMTTDEGVASVSDASGNLLFYTNGSDVYNRFHQLMPLGTGLGGHFSSSQSALIVQSAADSSQYYLFTVPAETNGDFTYSIIDMDLDGGKGDVLQKNIFLQSDVCEKLTAVRHADNKSVWVVVHGWNNNQFFAYPVDCNGVGAPVVSQAGSIIQPNNPNVFMESTGCMKISPDGSRIAYTWSTYIPASGIFKAWLEIASFNNRNGQLSNAITIEHGSATFQPRGYGVEFSPSSQYLYWSESGLNNGIGYSRLYQYDVTSANIPGTETPVGNTFHAMGSLQKGPDGKIYIARLNGTTSLSIVHSPDLPGAACAFDESGVSIYPAMSTWGLPNNWDTYPEHKVEEIFTFDDTLLCGADPLALTASYAFPERVTGYLWNTGASDSTIIIQDSGLYIVNVFLHCDTIRDSVMVDFMHNNFSLGDDTLLCFPEMHELSGPESFTTFLWSDGSTEKLITVDEPGLYILTATDTSGCVLRDSIVLTADGCPCNIYIPSAVTMNNDGMNDHLSVYSYCRIRDFHFILFNRWGQAVFQTSDPEFSWNCSMNEMSIPQNIYAYYLEYELAGVQGVKRRRGTVTFLR